MEKTSKLTGQNLKALVNTLLLKKINVWKTLQKIFIIPAFHGLN